MSGKTTDFNAAVQLGALVPAPDATTNVDNRDVVGNKADTEVGTGTAANSTLSLMAYLKALWDLLRGVVFSNLDATVSSRAASATALSTAQWSNTRAGYLDNLSVGAVAQAGTALSTAQWSNTRAGYLDNLSAGAVAQAGTALSTATWTATRAGNLDVATTSAFGGGSPTTLNSNASPNVKGSYAQIIASTAAACKWLLVELKNTGAFTYQVDIAIGGAGSEVIKIPDLLTGAVANQTISFLIPINIPVSTRIAARCQDSGGGGTAVITVQGF